MNKSRQAKRLSDAIECAGTLFSRERCKAAEDSRTQNRADGVAWRECASVWSGGCPLPAIRQERHATRPKDSDLTNNFKDSIYPYQTKPRTPHLRLMWFNVEFG